MQRELSAAERQVLDAIDEHRILEDLRELVAIPSVGGTPAEAQAQDWCGERLRGMGLAVDQWDIDVDVERHAEGFPGMEVEREGARGCVAVLGGGAVPGHGAAVPALALCGHTDVVPTGDLARWTAAEPFQLRVEGGTAFGRGACDMKGGLAAALGAVGAVAATGLELARPLAVHALSGEEDGGLGAFATLRRGHRAHACVIAEPTGGAAVPANAGSLTFRIEVEGRAAHGSTRTLGVSAIDLWEPVQAALRQLEAERNADVPQSFSHLDLAWPISVGILRAGDWASTVPDRLVAEGRYGVRPGESLEDARVAFHRAVAAAGSRHPWLRDHPIVVTWPGGAFAPGALPDGDPLLADVVACVVAQGGAAPAVHGAPYGSDLRHYAAAGVATLQYGPGEVRFAHAVDERVEVAEIVRCARVYALLALRRCGIRT